MTTCELLHGDCLDLIPTWRRPRFIFADPPFNIGHSYMGFVDRKKRDEFQQFNLNWMVACWDRLDGGGVFAIHVPDAMVDHAILWQATAKIDREAWIIWHYRFGQCGRTNWINGKCHCLIYRKPGEPRTWNPDAVLVPSDRAAVYGDKRINDTERGGQRLPCDVWGIPSDGAFWGRVQGNSSERRSGHPNQLPEVYLARLIRAYTVEGDLVADPFVGSGTTAVVAAALGRSFIGCDLSAENVASARERVASGAVRIQ